jgi:hypothetical protein
MGCPVLWDGMPSGISLRYSKTKKVGIYGQKETRRGRTQPKEAAAASRQRWQRVP